MCLVFRVCITACSLISNTNRHSRPAQCFISTHYYLLFADVKTVHSIFSLLLSSSLHDTFKSFWGIFVRIKWAFQLNSTSSTTCQFKTNAMCSKGAYSPGSSGGGEHSMDRALEQRPERLISILLPVNSLNLLPSPSRRQRKLPWPI